MNSITRKFDFSGQRRRIPVAIILALALSACCLAADDNQAVTADLPESILKAQTETPVDQTTTVSQTTSGQENPSGKALLSEKEREQEKRKLRVMLSTSIIILCGFFLGFLLITLMRIGRRYRRSHQSSRGKEPTELFDAWSNYHLDEDAIDLDDPDDPNRNHKKP